MLFKTPDLNRVMSLSKVTACDCAKSLLVNQARNFQRGWFCHGNTCIAISPNSAWKPEDQV